jgi:hypothetical protein
MQRNKRTIAEENVDFVIVLAFVFAEQRSDTGLEGARMNGKKTDVVRR